ADLRAALRPLLALDPAAGAAALAYLAITVDGAAPAPPCPQPDGGATAGERAEWAALHYSGQSRCFPRDDRPGHGGAGSPAAVRKRRSRAAGRMRDLLARAATAAGLEPQGALHG